MSSVLSVMSIAIISKVVITIVVATMGLYAINYQVSYSEHFLFSKLMNGPNKLECLSLASLSRLVFCNTSAYWAHSKVTNEIILASMAQGQGDQMNWKKLPNFLKSSQNNCQTKKCQIRGRLMNLYRVTSVFFSPFPRISVSLKKV
jgi:hypothetical protein